MIVQLFRLTIVSNAPCQDGKGKVIQITHPFHPLHGQKFELIYYRHGWAEEKVCFYRKDGSVASLPLAWCDLEPPDPYLVIGKGRSSFRVDDLLRLSELLLEVKQRPKSHPIGLM